MGTDLTTTTQGGLMKFAPEKVELIKRTVAKGTSNDELEMFLHIAARYGLDPFLKEIWCIKRQKKGPNGQYQEDPNAPAVIMTSRDGYLKIAQSDPNFEGLKSFVVKEGDDFSIDALNDQVIHKFGGKRGKILGAWAVCYHKQRKPAIAFVDFDEYNAGSPIWQKYPSAMIQKVAEVFVLKRQFTISGLVSQEEMSSEAGFDTPVIQSSPAPQLPQMPSNTHGPEWKQRAGELRKFAESVGVTMPELKTIGERVAGTKDSNSWSMEDMDRIHEYLDHPVPKASDLVPAAQATIDLPKDEDLPF